MYYPRCENKGADQLRGYREADLRLCFRLCRLLVFPWGGSFVINPCATNGFAHHYQFRGSTLISRSDFEFLFYNKILLGKQNSLRWDTAEWMPHSVASHLGPYCLLMSHKMFVRT